MQAKKILTTLLNVASVLLLAFLGWQAIRDVQFRTLAAAPKYWPLLVCALPICLAAVTITILRWHLLLRALGLTFSLRETVRAGFLAYFWNLAPFGMVGGDSLKAVMLIHRNMRRKTEAVASVFVDRVLGLYGLLLLAATASLFLPAEQLAQLDPADQTAIIRLCWGVQAAAVASTLGLSVMLVPAVTQSRWWDLLEHAPLIGQFLHKLVGAMRTYRRRVDLLLAAIGVSVVIHLLYVIAMVVMTVSIGIPPDHRPAVASLLVIVPPSMAAGALPIGFYEIAITLLFRAVSPPGAPLNTGLLIALGYRIIQICNATIGLGYWMTSRSEVRELVHEAEEEPPNGALAGDEPVAAMRA